MKACRECKHWDREHLIVGVKHPMAKCLWKAKESWPESIVYDDYPMIDADGEDCTCFVPMESK